VDGEVEDLKSPRVRGALRDITEKGLGITGIPARIGEIKNLVIPTDKFLDEEEISFEAECRWAKEETKQGQWSAGFQITKISEKGLEDLRNLIRSLAFHD